MLLHIHSDGSYLSAPKAWSRAGGHYFLTNKHRDPSTCMHNGAIYVLAKILKNVMSSAAEAEIGATFENGTAALPICTALEEMGHPQLPTPIQVDNTTAVSFANGELKQKKTKSIDMRFYWIQDRAKQGRF